MMLTSYGSCSDKHLLFKLYSGIALFLIKAWCLIFRMMWAAGAVAAMSSITFPAVSALVSRNADSDQQGKWNKMLIF